jgi:hypothetical protein
MPHTTLLPFNIDTQSLYPLKCLHTNMCADKQLGFLAQACMRITLHCFTLVQLCHSSLIFQQHYCSSSRLICHPNLKSVLSADTSGGDASRHEQQQLLCRNWCPASTPGSLRYPEGSYVTLTDQLAVKHSCPQVETALPNRWLVGCKDAASRAHTEYVCPMHGMSLCMGRAGTGAQQRAFVLRLWGIT